jgi:TolB-like protein/cytochrome c-type biogenesis protein CcmH/NrfG
VNESLHAVFLSYASQDAEVARRIRDALHAAGIEVWFDQSELRGGDVWDQTIRQRIHDCALFIPVISANTASRAEGYFRLEWSLADQRSHMIARNKSFIIPVCIDGTFPAAGDLPESFSRVQWTRLPGGDTPPAFTQRIATLLGGAADPARPSPAPLRSLSASRPRRSGRWVALIAAVIVFLATALITRPWQMLADKTRVSTVAEDTAVGQSASSNKSVAVLPFADMSERHDQEYFSDGLAEELIDKLTQIPQLRVPARTSSFSFKGKPITVGEIAHVLGVTHVLEGSVRKSGDHVRITAQLVRADSGFHVWSQTYDRDVRDIFVVQDDIAHAVAEELKITLLGSDSVASRQTTNSDAHNLYLQARFLMGRDTVADLDHAVLLYQQAVKLDPNYAAAWAGLAYCQIRRVSNGQETTGVGFSKATAAAKRAIELDPRLPEGYITLAVAKMQYQLDWSGTAEALAKAATLDANNTLAQQMHGHLSVATGRMSDALTHFRRSVDGDPLNLVYRKYLARALHYARRTNDAVAVLRDAISLDEHFPGLHYELGRTLLLQGDAKAALNAFEAESDPSWRSFGLPLGYFATNRLPEAQAALNELLKESAGSEFQVAETYGFFGETDKAFEWLDRTVTQHDPGIIWLRRDALLTSLEANPRYPALLKRIHVPPVSQND